MARWIDNSLASRGRCVSVAAGNAGQVAADANAPRSLLLGRIHAGGVLAATNLRQELGWIVGGEGISGLLGERDGDLVRTPGPLRRRGSPSRWRMGRSGAAGQGHPAYLPRRRDRAEHPLRGLPPGERAEPHLDPALPLLRAPRGRDPGDGADHLWRVASSADRRGRARRSVRRMDRARRPPCTAGARWGVELSLHLQRGVVHERPDDRLPGVRRTSALGRQRGPLPQRRPRHLEPRADPGRPQQARHRGGRHRGGRRLGIRHERRSGSR